MRSVPSSFCSKFIGRRYHHETIKSLVSARAFREESGPTYAERKCNRSTSFFKGWSSFRNTPNAAPTSLRSSNSRYFCCRTRNLSHVMSAPSDKGSPSCVEPLRLRKDSLSLSLRNDALVVFPFPNETPPSWSAFSVPNNNVSASSHSPSCTALRNADTLGISSWYPLSRDRCSTTP